MIVAESVGVVVEISMMVTLGGVLGWVVVFPGVGPVRSVSP